MISTGGDFDPARYWETRLAASSDLADVGYAGLGQAFNNWAYRVRRHVFRWALSPYLASISSAIDIGSGSGFYIDRWQEMGVADLHGCDVAAPALERLRKRYPWIEFAEVDIGDSADLLPSWQADAISAFDVAFHIVDDGRFRQALLNMWTMLKPGGLLLLTDGFTDETHRVSPHVTFHSRSEVYAAAQDAGFEVLSRRPSFVFMNEPIGHPHRFHARAWMLIVRLVRHQPKLGTVIGGLLYPLELLALRVLRRGPSIELMVCRKIERRGSHRAGGANR